MKWSLRILIVFVALSAVAQTQNAPVAVDNAAQPLAVPVPPTNDSSTTTTTQTPSPVAPSVPKEVLSWSTTALRTELIKSADAKKKADKRNKKKKLSDKKIKSLRSKIAQNEKDLKSRIQLAEHFEAIGEPVEVIELLRPAVSSLSREGVLTLARAYNEKKDYLQAIRVLDAQASKLPSDYVIQYLIGETYFELGKLDEAFKYFSEARRLNSNYLPAYEAILRNDKSSSQFHDALTTAQDMQRVFGDTPQILNELCLLYAHDAFLEKAVEVCKQAISASPKNIRNHVVLGLAIKEKEGNAAAAKVIQGAAKQFPKSELAQYVAGELNWERKNTLDSLKYFEKAIKVDPRSARSHLGRARSAYEEQKYGDALESYIRSCKLDRTIIADFRKTAGLFRKKNDVMWADRYNDGLAQCGAR